MPVWHFSSSKNAQILLWLLQYFPDSRFSQCQKSSLCRVKINPYSILILSILILEFRWKHRKCIQDYFNELPPDKTQSVIDSITKSYAQIGIVPDYNSLYPLPPQVYVTGIYLLYFRKFEINSWFDLLLILYRCV